MTNAKIDELEGYINQATEYLAYLKKERLGIKELLRLNTVDQVLETKNLQTLKGEKKCLKNFAGEA